MDIVDILANSPIDPQAHLSEERVRWYRSHLDEMEPVVVFDTGEGLLLVDGYHRVAAAIREGRTQIGVELRDGSRSDALAYAVENGARQRNRSSEEVRTRILHPGQGREPHRGN